MLKFDARFVEFTFNEAVAMLLADGLRLHLFKDSSILMKLPWYSITFKLPKSLAQVRRFATFTHFWYIFYYT